MYNAIIREWTPEYTKILGKTNLLTLSDLPETKYLLKYNSKVVRSVEETLPSQTNPLQIYIYQTTPLSNKEILITVETNDFKIKLVLTQHDTVESVKIKIWKLTNIPVSEQRLLFNGNQLKDPSWNLTEDCGVEEGDNVVCQLRGGELSNDDDNVGLTNSINDPFNPGLNVYATCPNDTCKRVFVIQKHYGIQLFTPQQNKINCPACSNKFTPSTFLVSKAKSLFRYKLADEPVQYSLVESSTKPTKFSLHNDMFIEVTTVRMNRSVYNCVGCTNNINFKDDEFKYDCGHCFHKSCVPATCSVCEAKIWSVRELVDGITKQINESVSDDDDEEWQLWKDYYGDEPDYGRSVTMDLSSSESGSSSSSLSSVREIDEECELDECRNDYVKDDDDIELDCCCRIV